MSGRSIALFIHLLGVVTFLWLMVNKPGWTQSVSVVIALGLLGAIVGSAAMRRGRVA